MSCNDCYHDMDTFPHRENEQSCATVVLQGPSSWGNRMKLPKTNLRFAELSRGSQRLTPGLGVHWLLTGTADLCDGIRLVSSVVAWELQCADQGLWRPRILCLGSSICSQSVECLQLALWFDFLCGTLPFSFAAFGFLLLDGEFHIYWDGQAMRGVSPFVRVVDVGEGLL